MDSKKIFLLIILAALVGSNVFFIYYFTESRKAVEAANVYADRLVRSGRYLNFLKLFINKVVKAESEVPFDDRLRLENAVRELNDPVIFGQWQKFVDSQAPQAAQENLKNLLDVIVSRVEI